MKADADASWQMEHDQVQIELPPAQAQEQNQIKLVTRHFGLFYLQHRNNYLTLSFIISCLLCSFIC